jgi:hypothetical protein
MSDLLAILAVFAGLAIIFAVCVLVGTLAPA